jgi:hypothetical protein
MFPHLIPDNDQFNKFDDKKKDFIRSKMYTLFIVKNGRDYIDYLYVGKIHLGKVSSSLQISCD